MLMAETQTRAGDWMGARRGERKRERERARERKGE
jgi:hypothetical protein